MTRSSFTRLVVILLVVLAAGIGWGLYQRQIGLRTQRIAEQIKVDLEQRNLPDDAPWRDRRTLTLLRSFYGEREMRPAWTTGKGLNGQARELVEVVSRAADEGLNPEHYAAAGLAVHLEEKSTEPKRLAEADLLYTIAAFHYLSDMFDGRISPRALDAEWVATPRKGDLDSLLSDALDRHRVKKALLEIAPAQEGYRKLREARARYARIVEAGGWPEIPPGKPLEKGQNDPRVATLRARLAASGDLDSKHAAGAEPNLFDDALAEAVAHSQRCFGRDPDGVVDETERIELNVSAEDRLRQIELNMERWRWLPKSFGEQYLIVNIPEFVLRAIEGGKPQLEMKVVVGKAISATPVFSDSLTHIIVNPDWNVPDSIVLEEIVPAVQSDPDYLAENHMRVFSSRGNEAQEIDPDSVDWSDSSSTRQLFIRQDPWEGNSLGRIKFMFPNQYDIYFHDTPAGNLFALEERGFSHGCVRLEDPVALASYLLRGQPEGNPDRIRSLIESGKTETLKPAKPMPVHIVYFTAFVEEDGSAGFREDLYGIDRELIQELRGMDKRQAKQAISMAK